VIVEIVGAAVVAGGVFYAGKTYGARVQAKVLADALKAKAAIKTEYAAVVADIKADTTAVLARIKALL
jgi:hypothetical protein